MTRRPEDNPFTPGYGNLPRVFAGRALEFADLELLAQRTRRGICEQARTLTGVRGIGKTALLREFGEWARDQGFWVIQVTAPQGSAMVGRIATALAEQLLAHDMAARTVSAVQRVLRLAGSLALRYGQPEWHVEYRGRAVQPGLASGDAGQDLQQALSQTCHLARTRSTGLVLLVDEAQNAHADTMAPLLYALQEVQGEVVSSRDKVSGRVDRASLPLGVVLAGLPSLPAAIRRARATFMARARSLVLAPLEEAAVREALPAFTAPSRVRWDADAIDEVVRRARGYPYFLHVYGYHAWNAGSGSTITSRDASAGVSAAAPMVAAFLEERLEELTDLQRRTAEAVANLSPADRGPTQVARSLGYGSGSAIASTLDGLIERGVIRRVAHGRYDFQIPGLGAHLRAGSARP